MEAKETLAVSATEFICKYSGVLGSILAQISSQKPRNSEDILDLTLDLDVENILKDYNQLARSLTHSYNQTLKLLKEIIFSLLTSNQFTALTNPQQISLSLKYTSMPDNSFCVTNNEIIRNVKLGNVVKIIGRVISVSENTKFVSSTGYKCKSRNCKNSDSSILRHFEVGFSESNVFRRDTNCELCRGIVLEDVSKRIMSEKRKLKIKLFRKEIGNESMAVSENIFAVEPINSNSSQSLRVKNSETTNLREQSIHSTNLILRGKNIPKVALGHIYHFVGQPVYGRSDYSSHLPVSIEVNNLWEARNATQEPNLPGELIQLRQACHYSEWSFVASLVFSFASEICHPTVYSSLKLAILLSLAGGHCRENDRENGNIHLLVLSKECGLVARILSYGSRMCPRGAVIAGGAQAEIGTVFQKEGTAPGDLIGGVLPLASEGVCFLPLYDFLKKDEKEKIQKALETGIVPVKVAKGLSNEDKQIFTPTVAQIPLNTSIWICSEDVNTKFKLPKTFLTQGSLQKYFSQAFTDAFTFVCHTTDDDVTIDLQSELMLNQAVGGESDKLVEGSDLKKWLEVASVMDTELTEECVDLLNTFFLASRRVRQSDSDSCQISEVSLDALISLSVASARLNLREKVLKSDATLAIVLFEEAMVCRFGYSVIGTKSNLFGWSPGCEMSEMIGKQFDVRMKMLSQQIDTFCSTHGPITREI